MSVYRTLLELGYVTAPFELCLVLRTYGLKTSGTTGRSLNPGGTDSGGIMGPPGQTLNPRLWRRGPRGTFGTYGRRPETGDSQPSLVLHGDS